jgi:hypothetical protein
MTSFKKRIRPYIDQELIKANKMMQSARPDLAFVYLERAHILGQTLTGEHIRVHWHMLVWGLKTHRLSEVIGQILRIVGAATKTAIGWVPEGNTGGANISPFKPLPIPPDLAQIIKNARM